MFRNRRTLVALGLAPLVVVAACSGGGGGEGTTNPPAASDVEAASPSGELVLDYTAFIPDVIQPSGIGVSSDGESVALVTDFEKVFVIEAATQDQLAEIDVARGELPEQGATEAVSFLPDGRLAVLYPDDRVIGFYTLDGAADGEVAIETDGVVDGAMTTRDGDLIVVAREGDVATLHTIDPATGESSSTALDGASEPFEGLSAQPDRDELLALTAAGALYDVDLATGTVVERGSATEVGEPSGVEVWSNVEEAEVQIAVTDDADEYNAEPSPLRLFLDT